MTQTPPTITELENTARHIRELIIDSLLKAGTGHTAGAMGMADVFTALYFAVMDHDPDNPTWDGRDYFILSNGHICPVLYATLATAGYFPEKKLDTLRKINSDLQGHPHKHTELGIENTSGPLGQGLSQAAGIATALKMDGKRNRVYCAMGDGEQQEGQNWEAYWYAGANRLNNLTVLIDRNNIQIEGNTEDVMPLHPFEEKLEAFNWEVIDINAHDMHDIISACEQARATQEQPTAIICNTIPGKGVEFMEDLPEWHGKPPNAAQAQEALEELRTLKGKIRYE